VWPDSLPVGEASKREVRDTRAQLEMFKETRLDDDFRAFGADIVFSQKFCHRSRCTQLPRCFPDTEIPIDLLCVELNPAISLDRKRASRYKKTHPSVLPSRKLVENETQTPVVGFEPIESEVRVSLERIICIWIT